MIPERIASVSDVIAERVIAIRKRLSMTRDELAVAARDAGAPASFTGVALRNLETGRRDPAGRRRREVSVDELVQLSAAAGCSPLDLLGEHAALFGAAQAECRRCTDGGGAVEETVRADIAALAELPGPDGGVEGSLAQTAYVLAAAVDQTTTGVREPRDMPRLTRELRATLEAIQAGRRGVEQPDDSDDDLDDLDEPD